MLPLNIKNFLYPKYDLDIPQNLIISSIGLVLPTYKLDYYFAKERETVSAQQKQSIAIRNNYFAKMTLYLALLR